MKHSSRSEIEHCQAGHAWERQALGGPVTVCPRCGDPAMAESPEPEDEQDYEGYGPH